MWEIRQTNFMGGYDTVIRFRWRWLARAISRVTSKRGCTGEGCTAGCTYVAKEEVE
jgi:hypothetical protein